MKNYQEEPEEEEQPDEAQSDEGGPVIIKDPIIKKPTT